MSVGSTSIALQDIVDFTGKSYLHDRWLASMVKEPGQFVDEPNRKSDVELVILNVDGELLDGFDFDEEGAYEGFVFARTPQIAANLTRKTVVNRVEKGDLPVSSVARKAASITTGTLVKKVAHFTAPSETALPRVVFAQPLAHDADAATKADRPPVTAQIESKADAPLALVPSAVIAAIDEKAGLQVNSEIDNETITASIGDTSSVQSGYAANKANDPRAIFEAVLARHNGKAALPQAPDQASQSEIAALEIIDSPEIPLSVSVEEEIPLTAVIEEDIIIPLPRLRPAYVASLDSNRKKSKKKQHAWASFQLPRSVHSAKQQRCLAAAIYFESRGEPVKGQAAVAQVVLNRVKAPAYPKTICGVVYQNKQWRNRCQFSFACDGVYDRVKNKKAWKQAVKIARDVTKGEIYLSKVADSTHYHARYVKPRWRRNMKIVDRIGVHIFYRTKRGGWS